MHHALQYWYLPKLNPLIAPDKRILMRKKRLMKEGVARRDHSRLSQMAWERASQTGLRCALLRGRSFGNLCDGITSVRLYHFWDGGGIRVGHLERSVRTFCMGDLSSHCHRQITDA